MSAVHRGLFAVVVAALTLLVPTSVMAQWRPLQDASVTPAFSPAEASGLVASSPSDTAAPHATVPAFAGAELPGEARTSRDAALMIVGGTAFILGALIGDDAGGVLMVGGAAVGLIGLYQFLR